MHTARYEVTLEDGQTITGNTDLEAAKKWVEHVHGPDAQEKLGRFQWSVEVAEAMTALNEGVTIFE